MTVKWDQKKAVKQVMRDPALARELLADGWKVAEEAAKLAPVGTPSGGGAKSIRAELIKGSEEPEVRVSWDRAHFWMGFAETGTLHQRANPFLRPAIAKFRR